MYEELLNILRKEKIVAILRDVPLEKFESTLEILKEEEIKNRYVLIDAIEYGSRLRSDRYN